MSSLRSVGRSAAARNNDRASLCSFNFADGRRCRTPRQSGDLQFCCFHARKQAQAQAAEDIGRDAGYFFSGRYLSACDLNAALGRVFAATAQGHVKPKTASALAYLAQVMVQCIHLTENEYAQAFGGDGWRKTISSSVNSNSDYINPPQPEPQPQSPLHSNSPKPSVGAGFSPSSGFSPASQPITPSTPVAAGFSPASPVPPPAPQAVSRAPHPSSQSSQPPLHSNSPKASVGAGFSPSLAPQSAATAPPSTRGSTSAIQSSTAAQSSTQQPVFVAPAATPSATPQKPTSAPPTGPSGAPMLASLPPHKPGAPPASRSS